MELSDWLIQKYNFEMECNQSYIDTYTFDNEIKYVLAPIVFLFLMKKHFKRGGGNNRKGIWLQISPCPGYLTLAGE